MEIPFEDLSRLSASQRNRVKQIDKEMSALQGEFLALHMQMKCCKLSPQSKEETFNDMEAISRRVVELREERETISTPTWVQVEE